MMRHKKNITLNLQSITSHFTEKKKIITLSLIIIMLSFTNITLSLSDTFYNSNVSALSYQTSTNVGFTFLPTLNVFLSSDNLTINNLVPGGNAVDGNTITINVSTNIAEGYNLYATVGNSNNETTNLTNVSNNNYTFTPLSSNVSELSNFANNNWGYSYSLDSGATWISGDYNNASTGYDGLPLYTDTGIKLVEEADNTSSTVDFKIAAKASSTQPSGEYTNVINFTVISNTIPTTMLDAFIASGAKMHNGYFKMQDMTSEICKSIDVEESELQLIDIRDDKVYWAAKLKDGNCWMTQNLDLDLTSNPNANNYIALTSENTDLTDTTSAAYQDGYTVSETGVITWLPERDTIAYNNLNSITWTNSNTDPYSYDYLDANGNPVYPDSLVTKEVAGNHGLSGNYYNWSAAVASNDTTNISVGNASNSVCPKSWSLPIKGEYGAMLLTQNIWSGSGNTYKDGGFDRIGTNPLYLSRQGYIYGGSFSGSGSLGSYWSGSAMGPSISYYLRFNNSGIWPEFYRGINYFRYGGSSVRCLAR